MFGRLPRGEAIGRFAPARVAVVDADGAVRLETAGAFSVAAGTRRQTGRDPLVRRRDVGLVVDPGGHRAYLIAAVPSRTNPTAASARLDLADVSWPMLAGEHGYACRDDVLRALERRGRPDRRRRRLDPLPLARDRRLGIVSS